MYWLSATPLEFGLRMFEYSSDLFNCEGSRYALLIYRMEKNFFVDSFISL